MRHDGTYGALHFCRRPRHGRFIAVRAVMADYFGWNVIFIRTLVIVALLWFNAPMLIAYFIFRIWVTCCQPSR